MEQEQGFSGESGMALASDLTWDESYQGTWNEPWKRKLLREWDWFMYDPITVNVREDGSQVVIDGKHRVYAIRELFGEDYLIPCQRFWGLTLEQEARRFDTQANRRRLTPWERYEAQLITSDPVALQVRDVVNQAGYEISEAGTKPRQIRSVAALFRVRKQFTIGILSDTLRLFRFCWPDYTLKQAQIRGLGNFLSRAVRQPQYSEKRTIQVLRQMRPTQVDDLMTRNQKTLSMEVEEAVAFAIHQAYNSGLSGPRRLPEWDSADMKRGPKVGTRATQVSL